jgi:hypothetical protein
VNSEKGGLNKGEGGHAEGLSYDMLGLIDMQIRLMLRCEGWWGFIASQHVMMSWDVKSVPPHVSLDWLGGLGPHQPSVRVSC